MSVNNIKLYDDLCLCLKLTPIRSPLLSLSHWRADVYSEKHVIHYILYTTAKQL